MYQLKKPLRHIAFIMDGNGRWANLRGLPRHLGHKKACEILTDIFDACLDHKIEVVSLYAFSTENWNRPKDEIDHLFDYLEDFFSRKMSYFNERGAKIIISGDIAPIRERTRLVILDAINQSKNNKNIVINICLNYGGKAELTRAAKLIAEEVSRGELDPNQITEQTIEDHLYTKGLPNVDLLIRTSGEQRTSNYLPWQLAYSEFIFTKTYWPDFSPSKLDELLELYDSRNRRFGGLKNE